MRANVAEPNAKWKTAGIYRRSTQMKFFEDELKKPGYYRRNRIFCAVYQFHVKH
jgi:hypothetical protein